MQVYKCFIRPMLSVPDQHYNPKRLPIEKQEKWYPVELEEDLYKKFKYLETTFEWVVFDKKYEPIEIVQCRDCKYYPKIDKNGDVEWPDDLYKCPGRVDDPYYDWMPPEDFFCANGERGTVNE